MTERTFRFTFSVALLVALYFDLHSVIYGLIALSLFRGVTPWGILGLKSQPRRGEGTHTDPQPAVPASQPSRFYLDAERVLSIFAAVILICGSLLFVKQLWFLPWFVGFAFFGSGLSGVCPMVTCLRWAGLK